MTHPDQENTETIALASDETIQKPAYPNVSSTVVLFFILISYTIIVAIPAVIILSSLPSGQSVLKSILNLAMYVAPLLITIKYTVRKSKQQQGYATSVNFHKMQGWLVPVIIIGTLAFVIPLIQISDLMPMPVSVQKLFASAFTRNIFSIGMVTIAAPILEEILCRGIILKGLLQNYPPRKAIIISAIFFAAIHLNPWQALPAFFGGLFLGWIYYKTRSVYPGMIVHATINITATSFLFLPTTKRDLPELLSMPYYLLALLVSVFVFAAACFIINKKTLVNRHPANL